MKIKWCIFIALHTVQLIPVGGVNCSQYCSSPLGGDLASFPSLTVLSETSRWCFHSMSRFSIFPKIIWHKNAAVFMPVINFFPLFFLRIFLIVCQAVLLPGHPHRSLLTSITKVRLPPAFSAHPHNRCLHKIHPTVAASHYGAGVTLCACPYYFMPLLRPTRGHNSYPYKCFSSRRHEPRTRQILDQIITAQ